MTQKPAQYDDLSIFETPISRAEASKGKGYETRADNEGTSARSGKNTSTPGGLRRRFFRTLGTLATVGLVLALLANLNVGPTNSDNNTPQKTKEAESNMSPANRSSKPSDSKSSTESSETKSSEAESSTGRTSQSGRRSYSYLGSVSRSVPETRSVDNGAGAKKGGASKPESSPGAKGQGNSPTQSSGHVPELTIRLGDRSLEEVAARFGYQMVAIGPSRKDSPESVVLGKIVNGRLKPMEKTELKQFAGRARSARKHPEYNRIRNRVARRLADKSAEDVRLIYLVPKETEKAFVRTQMEAIRKRGLSPEEVAVVKARYEGSSIEVTAVDRKTSQ